MRQVAGACNAAGDFRKDDLVARAARCVATGAWPRRPLAPGGPVSQIPPFPSLSPDVPVGLVLR